MDIRKLYWAAGFLEGEGSFFSIRKTPAVSAGQVDKQPIDMLVSIFGGTVCIIPQRGNSKSQYRWQIAGTKAVGVMFSLYSLMTDYRKDKISKAIALWKEAKSRPGQHNAEKTCCPKGHPYNELNTYITKRKNGGTMRRCKICQMGWSRKYRNSLTTDN